MNNALLNVIWDTMPAYGGAHEEQERKAALPIARLSYQHATTGASDVNVGGRERPRKWKVPKQMVGRRLSQAEATKFE